MYSESTLATKMILAMMLTMSLGMARVAGVRMRQVGCRSMSGVSAGQCGVWAVDPSGNIYYRNNTFNTNGAKGTGWITVDGALVQLDVGKNTVWGVNVHDYIYYRNNIVSANPTGDSWTRVDGALKHVSVSPSGHVWGVNANDYIYIRVGASLANPGGTGWKRISGALKQISVGVSGVWGVNHNNDVYYRDNTFGDYDPEGTGWTLVADMKMTYVSSAFGNVFGINGGRLFVRKGMSFANPIGTRWHNIRKQDANMVAVDSLYGYFWAIKNGNGEENSVWLSDLSPRC